MLYRKIESLIEAHLKSDSKKVLLIDGARQVGKTYLPQYLTADHNSIGGEISYDKSQIFVLTAS